MSGKKTKGSLEREFSLDHLDTAFRALAERLGVGVYLIQDGSLKYINKMTARMFGFDEAEVKEISAASELVHADDRESVEKTLRTRLGGTEDTLRFQFRGVKKGEGVIHVEAFGARILFEGRHAIMGTLVDVTDRVQADLHIESQLSKFEALYNLALAMVGNRTLDENLSLIVAESRKLLGTDTAWIGLHDREAGELCWHVSSGLVSEEFKNLRIPLGKGLAGKVASSGHWLIVEDYFKEIGPDYHDTTRAEGLFSGIAVPVQIGQSNFGVLFAFNRSRTLFSKADLDTLSLFGNLAAVEITRKRALENLSESEQRFKELYRESKRQEELYQAFLSSTVDAIIIYDAGVRAQYVNASFTRMFGWTLEDLHRGNVLTAANDDETDRFLVENVLRKGRPVSGLEARYKTKTGAHLDVSLSASPYHDPDGRISGMTLIFRDITTLKALDRAREKAVNHLSHELVTPISLIKASVQQLQNPSLEKDKRARILDRIQGNFNRLLEIQEIVQEIVVPGTYKPRAMQVDEAVRKILEQMRTRIRKSRNVSLVSSLAPVQTDTIDPSVLDRVVTTLVKNAVENTPDEGQVTISLSKETDWLVLKVEDCGVGIDPADREFIWKGFYHTQPTHLYSTRRPYDFGAGGKGLELMRLRLFADEGLLELDFESVRCAHLANGSESCSGVISSCPHITTPEECRRSGGTVFTVRFPLGGPSGEEE